MGYQNYISKYIHKTEQKCTHKIRNTKHKTQKGDAKKLQETLTNTQNKLKTVQEEHCNLQKEYKSLSDWKEQELLAEEREIKAGMIEFESGSTIFFFSFFFFFCF